MSREVDLTQPLSDEDRNYLEARGRHGEVAYADSRSQAELSDDERYEIEQRMIAEQKGKRIPLQMDPDAVRDNVYEEDEEEPEPIEQQEGDDPDDVAYVEKATVADLREQLSARSLSTSGNKPELQRRMLDALKRETQESEE